MRNHTRVLTASAVGTFLEFYDFAFYGFFAPIITQLFFPRINSQSALLMGYGLFAISFFARPIGALLIGLIGDTYGRRQALSISILFLGLPTLLIGVLPTYEQIGLYAPLTLIILRFLQGMCIGGEYNGAFIFAFEHIHHRQGFIGGIITSAAICGMVLAISMSLLVIRFINMETAWRIPFITGGLIAMVGFKVRRLVRESPEFVKLSLSYRLRDPITFFTNLQKHFIPFGMVFSIGAISSSIFYYQFIFLNGYCIKTLQMDSFAVMATNTFIMLVYALFLPLFGRFSDKIGHARALLAGTLALIALIMPMHLFVLEAKIPYLAIAQIVLSACAACLVAPSHTVMQRAFPVDIRYVAVSLSFSLGVCLLGGTTPLICTWLTNALNSHIAPALYLLTVGGLAFVFMRLQLNYYTYEEATLHKATN